MMHSESIHIYLTPRYDRAAVKASWNVFERIVTGIACKNCSRFEEVV